MPESNFQTTRWSIVLSAGSAENEITRAEALARLCDAYWFPIYAFIRRQGFAAHDAEDLTQGFFAHVLERDFIKKAQPEMGRFRGFLLGALRYYLANERERASTQRRGGNAHVLPIDASAAEAWMSDLASPASDPAECYERSWALSILEHAMSRLEAEQKAAGRGSIFAKLKPYLREAPEAGDYAAVAAELGIPKGTVTVTVYRLTQRFRDLVRVEVSHTVSRPDMIESELTHLVAVLRR